MQGVCARGVCKGCVQGVCKGCARDVTLPQIGRNLGLARDNIFSRFGSKRREEGMSLIDV